MVNFEDFRQGVGGSECLCRKFAVFGYFLLVIRSSGVFMIGIAGFIECRWTGAGHLSENYNTSELLRRTY